MAARIVHIGDQDLKFDPLDIDVAAALRIRAHTGMGLRSWIKACHDLDPVAVQAAAWLALRQNGDERDIGTLNFNVVTMYDALFTEEG